MKYLISLATMNKKTKVYHTEACPYANRIKYKNKLYTAEEGILENYKPCTCCFDDRRYLKQWVSFFENKGFYDLELKQVGNYTVYVKTAAGFWKIILSDEKEYVLYHRNYFDKEKTYDELIIGNFHRQKDVTRTSSLDKVLNYIRNHDRAKVIMDEDWRKLPTRTKKQKRYYKSAERRDKRRQVRNVFSLFAQLEASDPSLKKSCFV